MSELIKSKPITFAVVALLVGLLAGAGITTLVMNANKENIAGTVEISMTAYQWGFDPDYIEVDVNTKVILHIYATADKESQFAKHSFLLKAFDISVELPIGENTTIEFIADKAGEFTFECGIYCGTNHLNMQGTLVVKSAGSTDTQQQEETISPTTDLLMTPGSWDVNDMMIVVQREAKAIAAIDGKTHQIIGYINGIGHQPHTAVFSSDGKWGYLIGRGGWLIKFSLTDLSVDGYVRVGTSSRGTAITTDDKYVLVSNYEPSSFVVVDTETMKIAKEFQVPVWYNQTSGEPLFSRVASITDAPNNRMIVALKDLGEVWVINMNETDFPIEKIFRNVGGLLHDAFLTKDGRYYMLASQADSIIWIMDTVTLEEVATISTAEKPHPGPGALWGKYAFSPSVGEGALNVWDVENFEFVKSIKVGGPGLFARSYPLDESYPYIWWDTILSSNPEDNEQIHILDARTLNDTNPTVVTIRPGPATLKPEFTFDGKYVYVSSWQEDGKIFVIDAYTFEVVQTITGLTTPTGIFNVGLRLVEFGI